MILFTLPHHSTPHTPDNAWLPVPESVANTLEGYAHLEQSLTDRQINTCDDFPKPPPQPRNVPPRIAPKKKEKHNDQKQARHHSHIHAKIDFHTRMHHIPSCNAANHHIYSQIPL